MKVLSNIYQFPKFKGPLTAEYLNDDPNTGVIVLTKADGSPYAMMCKQDYEDLQNYTEAPDGKDFIQK